MFKIGGFITGLLGVSLLIYVFYPIFSYEIVSSTRFREYLLPVPREEEYLFSKKELDLAKASNWFDGLDKEKFDSSAIKYYTISIPSLKIKDATVAIGGEDLSQSLIQYPGTALPGKQGNAVIFGHSILPQFFNPKDYLTIFSTLPEIKKNDEVFVEYDGISYEYRVEDMFEVRPADIQILEQDTSDSFLTLITCVPPGHPLSPRRLIVRARLIPQRERVYENFRS